MKKSYIFIVIIIVILIVLFAGYYFNRGTADFEWYAFTHRKQQAFTNNKALFKQAFINRANISDSPQNYIELGLLQMSIGDSKAAEKNFQTALKRWPNNADALEQLFSLHKTQKEYEKAEADATQYIAAHPKNSTGYSQLIELYQFYIPTKAGEIPRVLDKAFKETGDSQFLVLAATYYADQHNYAKASDLLNQWLANPDNKENRQLIQNLYNEYKSKAK